MNKIKIKPKQLKRVDINKRFTLSPSSQGEISRSVLYQIKLRKLVRYFNDYGEKTGLDYERLCALVDAIESILNKTGVKINAKNK